MSFLAVSGLDNQKKDNGESNQVKNSLLDAIQRVVAPPPTEEEYAQTESHSRSKEKKMPTQIDGATADKPKIETIHKVVAKEDKPRMTKVPLPARQDTHFKAEMPDNVDDLPPLKDLIHTKLIRPLHEAMKIEDLTRIQKLCWNSMTNPKCDVLIRSETGSGKTLAYALPIIHQILTNCDTQPISREDGTLCIIMCPTRELILQVADTLGILLRCAQFITVGGIHGGENRHKEKARLRKGIHILVCTPGRLLDHLKQTSCFFLGKLGVIVMDEADRLLDLGFEKAIREIMGILPSKCADFAHVKRVLVSATITDGVERLSHFALRENIKRVGETEDTFSIPATLRQNFVSVPMKHRLSVLFSFVRAQLDSGAEKMIVFVGTADESEFLYYVFSRLKDPFRTPQYQGTSSTRKMRTKGIKKFLEKANQHVHDENEEVINFVEDDESDDEDDEQRTLEGRGNSFVNVNVFKLHGNMTQVDRAAVFNAFKHGNKGQTTNKGVLFCTDVAARGLDMPQIDWIVHYDPPVDTTSYIHRIGRTARIGKSGDSILFLTPTQIGYADYLTNFIRTHTQSANGNAEINEDGKDRTNHTMQERKYERFLFYLTKLDSKSNYSWPQSTSSLERAICNLVMGRSREENEQNDRNNSLQRIAFFAYQSYIRAYAGLPRELKNSFFSEDLHLGHVAHSFGIDKSPKDVQRDLQQYIKEDKVLSRDNRKGTTTFAENSTRRKRQRVEISHDDRYHSMVVQKQRKITRDWAEKRREQSTRIKPHQFSEFDA